MIRARSLAVALALCAGCRSAPPTRTARRATPGMTGSDAVERVVLGGEPQAILVRGIERKGPIVLFLHGGPGNSEMTLAHRFGPLLEARFTVVYWDQRGAGRSYRSDLQAGEITLARIAQDAVDLVELLHRRFPHRPIVLVGHSWGSLLGVIVVQKRPDLFCAYVGVGQFVDAKESLRLSHQFALDRARQSAQAEAVASLESMNPPTPAHVGEVMRWVTHFGGEYHGASDHRALEELRAASPIRWEPWERTYSDQALSMNSLGATIVATNFLQSAPSLDVPVLIIEGRDDHVTPGALAARWLEQLRAPWKRMVWFERSAHHPHIEEPERFAAITSAFADDRCR
jgi:pimeloyl-ACP methyl ester carboxylesterase